MNKINNHKKPTLSFYHPNGKGTGCALEFELNPAREYAVDGYIKMTVANQMTVGSRPEPNPTFPRFDFDWENVIDIRLDFDSLCKILQVLRGETESIDDGKGMFFRSTEGMQKTVRFRHSIEPIYGYVLEVECHKINGDDHRAVFAFTYSEALGLCEAISGSMSLVAFGYPRFIEV